MRTGFVLAMARRELRASRRRLLLYGGCMALGIAALVSLHGFRAATLLAVDSQSRNLLGADLQLSSRAAFGEVSEASIARLVAQGGVEEARIVSFGSMALAERVGRTRMVQVRAISGGFPFYGELRTDPAGLWPTLESDPEPRALVDPAVLIQLDSRVGDVLKLGEQRFRIAGTVPRAPGSIGLRSSVAPRVYIGLPFVEATGLLQHGSLVEFMSYFGLQQPLALQSWLAAERSAIVADRVRIRTVASYREELSGNLSAFTRYLGMVGFVALLLGGIGVAAGVRVFARDKLDTAAVLRALGASESEVLTIYLLQAAALGLVGGVFGTALGVGVQLQLPVLLAAFLPLDVPYVVEARVIATGLGLGLWVSLLFALWPLLELHGVPPLRALRRDFAGEEQPMPPVSRVVPLAVGVSLLATALWQAPTLRSGFAFAAGLAVAIGLLALVARFAMEWLRRHFPRRAAFWLRQGVANLFRPRNQTLATVLAVGTGVFLVATLHLVERNLVKQLELDASPDRPNLVLFDVQPDQAEDIEARLAAQGAPVLERAALISARVAGLRGEAVGSMLADKKLPSDFRWALRREYRLTYSVKQRESETVVAGEWWPPGYAAAAGEPHAISLEEDLAQSLGVGVGDQLTWDIQGVTIETRVANLRQVDWGRLATNFFVVFAPGALEDAPQNIVLLSHIADEETRAELTRDLVAAHPNIAALDATVILAAVDSIMAEVSLAIRFMALFTLGTGFVILLAAISTSRFQRVQEALLLRTLGGDARTIRRIVAAEHLALGALAATVGLVLATTAAWLLVVFWFEQGFELPLTPLALVWSAVVLTSLVVGWANTRSALAQPPLAGLRRVAEG